MGKLAIKRDKAPKKYEIEMKFDAKAATLRITGLRPNSENTVVVNKDDHEVSADSDGLAEITFEPSEPPRSYFVKLKNAGGKSDRKICLIF